MNKGPETSICSFIAAMKKNVGFLKSVINLESKVTLILREVPVM